MHILQMPQSCLIEKEKGIHRNAAACILKLDLTGQPGLWISLRRPALSARKKVQNRASVFNDAGSSLNSILKKSIYKTRGGSL